MLLGRGDVVTLPVGEDDVAEADGQGVVGLGFIAHGDGEAQHLSGIAAQGVVLQRHHHDGVDEVGTLPDGHGVPVGARCDECHGVAALGIGQCDVELHGHHVVAVGEVDGHGGFLAGGGGEVGHGQRVLGEGADRHEQQGHQGAEAPTAAAGVCYGVMMLLSHGLVVMVCLVVPVSSLLTATMTTSVAVDRRRVVAPAGSVSRC